MGRGLWWATVLAVEKFEYNLATKQQRAYLGDGLRKK